MIKSWKWINGKRCNVDYPEDGTYIDVPQSMPNMDIMNTQGSVRCVDNTIHFYSDINTVSCAELNRLLHDLDTKLRQTEIVLNNPSFKPLINLRINSFGGDVFAGLSTVDTIRNLKSTVHTYVEGAAASAATIISVCGAKRFIGKNSLMLIHQLSSIMEGTFEQQKDDIQNSERIMGIIKSIYKQNTKIPMKELDEILKRDLWFDSATCLKYGLVDEIQ